MNIIDGSRAFLPEESHSLFDNMTGSADRLAGLMPGQLKAPLGLLRFPWEIDPLFDNMTGPADHLAELMPGHQLSEFFHPLV